MSEEEEARRKREEIEAEYRKRIRNGQRRFTKDEQVAARLLGVDLAELKIDEEEEAHREKYAG
jgi:hypothetical protein